MKKLILILGILLATIVCMGQQQINKELNIQERSNHVYDDVNNRAFYIPDPNNILLTNITVGADEENNGWAQHGESCAGCPSYFYKIFVTDKQHEAEDGMYYFYYYFYFYSNSYHTDGTPAGTYLSHVHFFGNDEVVLDIEYILIDAGELVLAAWIRSLTPNSTVLFKPTKVTVY